MPGGPDEPLGNSKKRDFLATLSEESVLFTAAGASGTPPLFDATADTTFGRQKEAGTRTNRCPNLNSLLPDGLGPGTGSFPGLPVLLLDVGPALASISQLFPVLPRRLRVYYGTAFSG